MKVRMVETRRGSEDGVTIAVHEAGKSYDLCNDLAEVYVREGWAAPTGRPTRQAEPPVADTVPVVSPERNTALKAPKRRKRSVGK